MRLLFLTNSENLLMIMPGTLKPWQHCGNIWYFQGFGKLSHMSNRSNLKKEEQKTILCKPRRMNDSSIVCFLDLFTNTCIPCKRFPNSFYSVYSCRDIPLLKPMKHKIHNMYYHMMPTFRGLLPSCLSPYTRRSLSILIYFLSSTIQSLLFLQNEAN